MFSRYYEKDTWLLNPSQPGTSEKFEKLIGLFQACGERFGFDWLAIGAQAYQESGFDQSKKSRAGAVGMVQIRPATAADKNVGVSDVSTLENNVHAGVKNLSFVRDHYFSEDGLGDQEKVNFALASFNAGPRRIVAARSAAAEQGLDPNQRFFNIEHVVSQTNRRQGTGGLRAEHPGFLGGLQVDV